MHPKIIHDHLYASSLLQAGKLVSFPTETVYGLGADARDLAAIAKVFSLKQRPLNHPLIVHIADINLLPNVACNIPTYAYLLAQNFWPGALTLVLKKSAAIDEMITGGQGTVAVRIPAHDLTRELLKGFPLGIVGPSANKFGKISPTCALHVIDDLGDEEDFTAVLDGGTCTVGIESTIIDCSRTQPSILRHGQISRQAIEEILGATLHSAAPDVRISGNLKSHYAPQATTLLGSYAEIIKFISKFKHKKIGVLSFINNPHNFNGSWLMEQNTAKVYAQHLYNNLRTLDKELPDYILIEKAPENMLWQGINDRLKKAASKANLSELLALDKTFVHA